MQQYPDVVPGDVLRGFGLANAGRYATVVSLGRTRGRALIERHLDGKRFWTFLTYWAPVDGAYDIGFNHPDPTVGG